MFHTEGSVKIFGGSDNPGARQRTVALMLVIEGSLAPKKSSCTMAIQ